MHSCILIHPISHFELLFKITYDNLKCGSSDLDYEEEEYKTIQNSPNTQFGTVEQIYTEI